MTAPVDTARLRALHAKATEGEWGRDYYAKTIIRSDGGARFVAETQSKGDAAFVVAAHTTMPALLDEVEALRALLSEHATRFDIGDVKVIRIAGPASMWWVCPRDKDNEMIDTRDEAIARARELAAKDGEA